MKLLKYGVTTIVVMSVCAVLFLLACVLQFELNYAKKIDLSFNVHPNKLSGSLLLPEGQAPFPVVIFVHGDGPQDRFANSSYTFIINAFLDKGIACFLWDKPGVNASTGNWLNQTMEDRADEILEALNLLANRPEVNSKKIGVLGFSQGGWVLPNVAMMSESRRHKAAFFISVGGAINWERQGAYFTRTRLQQEGYSTTEVETVINYLFTVNKLIKKQASYKKYVKLIRLGKSIKGLNSNPMSKERFRFVSLNINVDIENKLQYIKSPFLAILGEKDLNVDTAETASIYQKAFSRAKHSDYQVVVLNNATHGLLNANSYNFQIFSQWTWQAQLRYLIEGESAFVPGYLSMMGDWVVERVKR
ncbi:alpha/beta hydrolase family protein [Zooshikella sp. RANM57]|uniref:alpha/beta hydrolase family protein n=1 Tax=Zooshikella sp. RANM57 TaxID=3425863 RepID=UPI003D6E2C32